MNFLAMRKYGKIWEKLRQNAKRCKENAWRKFREAHPVNEAVEKAQSIARRKIIEKSIALLGEIQEACARGNIRVRSRRSPARSKFNTANTGGSSSDDDSSEPPEPGARAYYHPSSVVLPHSKKNKPKYLNGYYGEPSSAGKRRARFRIVRTGAAPVPRIPTIGRVSKRR
jgi:hypothetical protein